MTDSKVLKFSFSVIGLLLTIIGYLIISGVDSLEATDVQLGDRITTNEKAITITDKEVAVLNSEYKKDILYIKESIEFIKNEVRKK